MDKAREEQIAKFWADNSIYHKAKEARALGKKFYFLDGPPYATGAIHMGTAWNKILKDAYIRFWRMKGFAVRDQPGYDTHGMPIENKVEKELELRSKRDIEKLGVEAFTKRCREFATKFIGVMSGQFKDLGIWMDFDNPYLTLDKSYIEGAWATFKIGYEKKLLYHDVYPVHVCPHCETAVAYNEIEYAKATDPSVYVKFKVTGKKEFLVIWTTTPWTLPANAGIMVHPKEDYVRVDVNGEVLIIAKPLLVKVMEKAGVSKYKIIETFKGKALDCVEYEHPLKNEVAAQQKVQGKVILSEQYVTMEDGTGLVHTAPGHGEEDYKAGRQNGLSVISVVGMNGVYTDGAGKYEGMFVKKADREIISDLTAKGALLKEEKITHDYPQCWRCSSPLLQMAVKQWFFKVTDIRKKLMEENDNVSWQPEWAKKRFANWLESLGDWPISRQRYWGIPLPIWTCECGEVKVIGSAEELPKALKDLHRPYVDEILLECKCGKSMKRIPDVLDVWFDSGLAAWASMKKGELKKYWPSDFQTEGPDQIRGWWNSQLITSVITFGEKPFKNILFHGFVLDAHGIKMSKSKGNVTDPFDVVNKHGRDVLRYYLLSSAPWDDFYFKWTDVDEIAKAFFVVENAFKFVGTYVLEAGDASEMRVEDAWILSRLNSMIKSYNENFSSYNGHKAMQELYDFLLNDFSRWYIKLVRERAWPTYDGKDKRGAFYALGEVAKKSAILLAPICPFLAEEVYQKHMKPLGATKQSVHLEDILEADKRSINAPLERDMFKVREITEAASSLRQDAGIKLRWPLAAISLEGIDVDERLHIVLKEICNVKSVVKKGKGFATKECSGGKVGLDTKLSEELKQEATLREVLRKVQQMRKASGLEVKDDIELSLSDASLKGFEEEIKKQVGAKKIRYGADETDGSANVRGEKLDVDGKTIFIGVRKI